MSATLILGFSLESLTGMWNQKMRYNYNIDTNTTTSLTRTVFCSKLSDTKITCQWCCDSYTGRPGVIQFDYDPASMSLSYDGMVSFRPKFKADGSSTKVLYWLAGTLLEKIGTVVYS